MWEREVETHIRRDLVYWLTAPGAQVDDPRGLALSTDAGGPIIGLVAHRRADLLNSQGRVLPARQLHVVALSGSWQGRDLPDGRRASDVLMTAAFVDIRARPDEVELAHAVVHRDNVRSLALCRRHGMRLVVPIDNSYLRVMTPPGGWTGLPKLD